MSRATYRTPLRRSGWVLIGSRPETGGWVRVEDWSRKIATALVIALLTSGCASLWWQDPQPSPSPSPSPGAVRSPCNRGRGCPEGQACLTKGFLWETHYCHDPSKTWRDRR